MVCPLPTRALVTVLQMLTEVISPEKLLRLVAFAKLVNNVQVFGPSVPLSWVVCEAFATITTDIDIGQGR